MTFIKRRQRLIDRLGNIYDEDLLDKIEEKEKKEDRILDRMLLGQLLETLNPEERQLIYLRYFADKTQTDVGKIMGISQVQVSRLEKKILENMRKMSS